jgi:hypothetical protein
MQGHFGSKQPEQPGLHPGSSAGIGNCITPAAVQAAGIGGLLQSSAPVSTPSNPPNMGNSIDLMA